jgi:hypothetical protein
LRVDARALFLVLPLSERLTKNSGSDLMSSVCCRGGADYA